MPPQDSVRLNNSGQTEQAWPELGHPYQQGPFTTPQPEILRCPPQSDVELMTKKEVLNFKPVSRLEQVGDIRSKQVDDHKHRIGWCADSALPRESGRMEFSGITGVYDTCPFQKFYLVRERPLVQPEPPSSILSAAASS
jgi:hypothetical protein